jgi:hypothetical protein
MKDIQGRVAVVTGAASGLPPPGFESLLQKLGGLTPDT